MSRTTSFFFLFFMAVLQLNAQYTLRAPDADIRLNIDCDESGKVHYTLKYNGAEVIKKSVLGFSLVKPDVDLDFFDVVDSKQSSRDENWMPVWGEVSVIRNRYNELGLLLREKTTGIQVRVVFRLFNDGAGFRYEFPEQKGLKHFIIGAEKTQFAMASDNKTFWIPGDYDTNEYLYNTTLLSEIDAFAAAASEKDIAVQALFSADAVQTPLMMKTPTGVYINIHEAALLDYPAMNLVLDRKTLALQVHLVPDAVGNSAYLETPARTPWRTILVSDKAADMLSSKTILNLNEPAKISDTRWIKPQKFVGVWWEMHTGKGSWDLASGKHAAHTANVKRYIDFAAKHGFDGVLVEGWNTGWEDWFGNWKEDVFDFVTPYPDYDVKALSSYAKAKKVKIIMHHETSGAVTNYERQLDTAFHFMQKYGMNTIKTGYVGRIIPRGEHHDGQWMNRHYVRVAEKAARNKIMIEAHEPSHPTGLHRTYPNWLANEAARGNEFNNAPTLGITPEHHTILPFTRLMGGPMDFTPGLFHFNLNEFVPERTTVVRTTLAKQLALYVTMYSPLQMAGDLPEHYEKYPDAFKFITDVPVDWADTKILEAEPGDYITIARKEKTGYDWFVGGISDENARTAIVDFSFLDPKTSYLATFYEDAPDAGWNTKPEAYIIRKEVVTAKTVKSIKIAPGGGFAVSLEAAIPK